MNADEIIRLLQLERLPQEGGYFRRTYTATATHDRRALATMIHYLITPEEFSAFHLLEADEIFSFHLGDPVEMVQITEGGELSRHVLGPALDRGQRVQVTVPGSTWQGSRLVPGGRWALLGCTVIPGFEYGDYLIGGRDELAKKFPRHASVIRELTRGETTA